MKHILYLSRAVQPLSDQDLHHLLAQSRRNNAQHGITGVLFYSHGRIAQLFEGEDTVADALFNRIVGDARHTHVVKHIDKPIAQRSFAGWSMTFHPLEPAGFAQLQGFVLPHQLPPLPATLTIADALLLELVQLAVFGPDPAKPASAAFPSGERE